MDKSGQVMPTSIPVIGITGGIGSGKSFVSKLFASFDCVVANADDNAKVVLNKPETQAVLSEWWGEEVITDEGQTNRSFIASIVFNDGEARDVLVAAFLNATLTDMGSESVHEHLLNTLTRDLAVDL